MRCSEIFWVHDEGIISVISRQGSVPWVVKYDGYTYHNHTLAHHCIRRDIENRDGKETFILLNDRLFNIIFHMFH